MGKEGERKGKKEECVRREGRERKKVEWVRREGKERGMGEEEEEGGEGKRNG